MMYKHVLVATDGSDVGQKGVDHGVDLARQLGAQVTVLTVTEPYPLYAGDAFGMVPSDTMMTNHGAAQDETANAILAAARESAKAAGVQAELVHVADAQPAEAILHAAQSRNCDLIVMGSHGRRGVGRLLLGSKAWEVVAHGHVPVLVVR
ncbi:universal stress protein [Novosphingobium sp. M1R2S20]|uniref:Universal stress protein n=1 Tax=Novosphingobium rhizovicinum TaxID=3228928 RepID=A0ABV3RG11_9SPHN